MKFARAQKGSILITVIVLLLILVSLGYFGTRYYKFNNSGIIVKKHLSLVRLSFWYPNSWQVISNGEGLTSGYFEIKSPDGFELGFIDANSAFFSGGNTVAAKSTASEVIKINNVGSEIISADSGTGNFNSITVVKNSLKVGDAFYPDDLQFLPRNPSINSMYVQINGGFLNKSSGSLAAFNNQKSVKQANQILQSLKYY